MGGSTEAAIGTTPRPALGVTGLARRQRYAFTAYKPRNTDLVVSKAVPQLSQSKHSSRAAFKALYKNEKRREVSLSLSLSRATLG
jgi:hypothetical protein